jgi:hypothetical protein
MAFGGPRRARIRRKQPPSALGTVFKGISGKAESLGSPIADLFGFPSLDFTSCNTVLWTEPKPGGETFLCAEGLRVETNFRKNASFTPCKET